MGKHISALSHSASANILRAGMAVTAGFTLLMVVLAVLSVTHSDQAFAAVQTHFAEPASFYPTATVASLLLMIGAFSAIGWAIFQQTSVVHKTSREGKFISVQNADRLTIIAVLIALIELARYPIASVALSVETAFKGPTSEVAAGAPVSGLIAAAVFLAIGSAIRTTAQQTNANANIKGGSA